MSIPVTYSKTIGRVGLEVEFNRTYDSSPVVLRVGPGRDVKARFTIEELYDLHYATGRAIAAVEQEQK